METDGDRRGNNDEGDIIREDMEEGRTCAVTGERREGRDQQQHRTPQQQRQSDTRSAQSTGIQRQDTVSRAAEQTPMQLVQRRLRDRFGADILRQPEETVMQRNHMREECVGTSSSLHVGPSAEANEEPETPEERYQRMGKAQITEATPARYSKGETRRHQVKTPPTTRYAGPQLSGFPKTAEA